MAPHLHPHHMHIQTWYSDSSWRVGTLVLSTQLEWWGAFSSTWGAVGKAGVMVLGEVSPHPHALHIGLSLLAWSPILQLGRPLPFTPFRPSSRPSEAALPHPTLPESTWAPMGHGDGCGFPQSCLPASCTYVRVRPGSPGLTYAWSASGHFLAQKQTSLSPFPEGCCMVLSEDRSDQTSPGPEEITEGTR